MKSTRECYTRLQGAEREADLAIRKAVRAVLREYHGADAKPPGRGWMYSAYKGECVMCDATPYDVLVPGFEATTIFVCLECGWVQAFAAEDLAGGIVPAQLQIAQH